MTIIFIWLKSECPGWDRKGTGELCAGYTPEHTRFSYLSFTIFIFVTPVNQRYHYFLIIFNGFLKHSFFPINGVLVVFFLKRTEKKKS